MLIAHAILFGTGSAAHTLLPTRELLYASIIDIAWHYHTTLN